VATPTATNPNDSAWSTVSDHDVRTSFTHIPSEKEAGNLDPTIIREFPPASPLSRPEDIRHDPSATKRIFPSELQDLNHERQKAATAHDQFEAFVTDNLGSLAPNFANTARRRSYTSMYESRSDRDAHGTTGTSADVQMEGRVTFDLEERFGQLPPEDAAYLQSKGIAEGRLW
jgi:hypothetical protein